MKETSGAFKTLWGTSDGIAGDGGAKGVRLFLPFLGGPAMESLGTGAGRGKASSCFFLPLCAPLRPFAPRSQRFHRWSSKKKGEKFGS